MLVSDLLNAKELDVIGVTPDMTVEDAARTMTRHGIGAVLVLAGDRVLGIVSERDIARGVAARGGAILADRCGDIMTRAVVVCEPDNTVESVMTVMTERRIRHLPVVRRGRLVGVISIGDVVKAMIEEVRHEAEDLRRYIVAGE
ncbi:MAG: CBS domain-containing protein [Reyranellaceae bacterium]